MSNSSTMSQKVLYTISLSLGVTMISAVTYWYYNHFKKNKIPARWRRIGTLTQCNLFPVKSCGPLQFDPSLPINCESLGIRIDGIRDRALMLIDDTNKMITARTYPKMVLIKPKFIGSTILSFSAPGRDNLELDFSTLVEEAPGKDIHTDVWETKLDAMLCGEQYDRWFSQAILDEDTGLRLVYYPYPKPVRSVNRRLLKEPQMTDADTGTFSDATSYMLLNLASIHELNSRLKRPVDPLQFRGNFQLQMDNDEPYAEDTWCWIKIGENATFRVVGPCTRCIVPNINVDTGERDPDFEPQTTLKKYRMLKHYTSPGMGIYLGVRQSGVVRTNDVIYVEDK